MDSQTANRGLVEARALRSLAWQLISDSARWPRSASPCSLQLFASGTTIARISASALASSRSLQLFRLQDDIRAKQFCSLYRNQACPFHVFCGEMLIHFQLKTDYNSAKIIDTIYAKINIVF